MTCYLVENYDYPVFVVDKLDYCSSLQGLSHLNSFSHFHFIQGDITCPETIDSILKKHDIDTILHLAAQTHVDHSFGDSLEFTKNNIYGTHVLLEGARKYRISKFIHVSTDEVYGEVLGDNLMEESILAPTNPYAATKAAAEMLVLAYQKSFQIPIIISRSNNVYGPFQFPEKVIPKWICSLLNGQKCFIHGNGSHTRRYLYVSDVVEALVTVLHKGKPGTVYNIGTDFEISNLKLAHYLLQKFGYSDKMNEYIQFVPDRAFNDKRYAIDSSKMEQLGWKPRISFEKGMDQTSEFFNFHFQVEWYQKFNSVYWPSDISWALEAHPQYPKDGSRLLH